MLGKRFYLGRGSAGGGALLGSCWGLYIIQKSRRAAGGLWRQPANQWLVSATHSHSNTLNN